MTSKERMLRALAREQPDRLPVTVHQWQGYHLQHYLGGMGELEAFRLCGMDAAVQYFESMGQFWLPGIPEMPRTPQWRPAIEVVQNEPAPRLLKYRVETPAGDLTYATAGDEQTTWLTEYMIKQPQDLDKVAYMPVPRLDQQAVARAYDAVGDAGILRGFVWGDQAGCWQQACCLAGTQEMILAAIDDPAWTHRLLRLLLDKKFQFIEDSLQGARFDIIETGGGAASSTVISPALFREFCLPYDRELHQALHRVGQRVVYHTCGGMMGLLDLIPATEADASETLAPPGVGGDLRDRARVKQTLGSRCALIGGMDQHLLLTAGAPGAIRDEVRDLFAAFGAQGGYILSTADHFFDALVDNLRAYAQAARECVY